MQGKQCPYCGKATRFCDSSVVYRRSYGMIYYCRDCRAWVGVHKGTDKALGRLADATLRKCKQEAHSVFDRLWKKKMTQGFSRKIARSTAYLWLAGQMDIDPQYCHIGMFDEKQCAEVIRICKKYYK